MANPKQRASMREGPLAALFRKTEEDERPASEPAARATEQQPELDRLADAEQSLQGRLGGAPPQPGASDARSASQEPALTPKQRLLHAFSSEIPGNVLDSDRAQPRAVERRYAPQSSPQGLTGKAGHPLIKVVGVGGAGTNAVNRMVEAEVQGVEFIAVNTDLQSLQQSSADLTVHIGVELTRGLGSGSDAGVGRQAAMDDYDHVKALLRGSDLIFIAAGAGGGTGTGAAPVIARIAREVGALAVAIVTKPFGFEGSRRAEQADYGIELLAEEVDTLIVVPNNRLLSILDKQTSIVDAFKVADDVLRQGVQGISDLVTLPGLINLDFADVRTIMSDAGNALLGIGMGVGEARAVDAAMQAVSSPLLETSMEGARSILLSITGGEDLSLWEVNEAAKAVSQAAHRDANIIFGAMVDEKLDDQVWVTVVATGYDERTQARGRSSFDERPRAQIGQVGARRLSGREGEPRITRTREPVITDRRRARAPARGRGSLAVQEHDIPEFLL